MRKVLRVLGVLVGLLLLAAAEGRADIRRASAFLEKGAAAMEKGELSQAEELLLKARQADPGLPHPEVLLGQIAMERGDFPAAEESFSRALELFVNLKSHLRQQVARSSQDVRDEVALLAADLEVTANRPGRRRQTESDIMQREALKLQEESRLDRQPDVEEEIAIPADLFLFLGNARMRQGKFDPAAEAYREAVSRASDAPEPRHNLAVALAQGQHLEEALEESRAAEAMGYAPSAELRRQLEEFLAESPAGGPAGEER